MYEKVLVIVCFENLPCEIIGIKVVQVIELMVREL